ncbi:MAG TPA: DUF2461 domain-containing protein [Salinivirgaceae bacterium]|nr:DUF2461 domain-containing protein [Salinivirgaceae bacterium]
MLHPDTIPFLSELKANNHRPWFQQNRNRYEAIRSKLLEFVSNVLVAMQSIDSRLVGVEPKQCIFRINRDIRFSNDKSPYKTHFGIILAPNRRFADFAGYYLHIEPNNCFIGGGIYMPSSIILKKIRVEIADFYDDIFSILSAESFKNSYQGFEIEPSLCLKNPPAGYSSDHPAIDLLKLKSFTVSKAFNHDLIQTDDFQRFVIEHFTLIKPINDFLNRSLSE